MIFTALNNLPCWQIFYVTRELINKEKEKRERNHLSCKKRNPQLPTHVEISDVMRGWTRGCFFAPHVCGAKDGGPAMP
jgi:hypothetical protein